VRALAALSLAFAFPVMHPVQLDSRLRRRQTVFLALLEHQTRQRAEHRRPQLIPSAPRAIWRDRRIHHLPTEED
jgi:hypothetical protein